MKIRLPAPENDEFAVRRRYDETRGRARPPGPARMSSSTGTLRVAVIDRDSAFLKVLAKRLDAAGWQHRVLGGIVPAEELVAMKLNALVLDMSVLPPEEAGPSSSASAGCSRASA